jgi:hypothetical protein
MAYVHPLHERVRRVGWQEVGAIVSTGIQEAVDLDFKNKSDPSNGVIDKKDREILAQTLTAFANSMGGLLVFGIDCRSQANGPDQAQAINPIRGTKRFLSDVSTNIPNLAMPRLEDVTVDIVENPANPDVGVLLISVGRSERRPHRSEAAGDKRYYKRSGSNTLPMEHFDIEDAFHRISVAKLEIGKLACRTGGGVGDIEQNLVSISLANASSMSARFPYLNIKSLTGGTVWDGGLDGNGNFPLRPSNGRRTFAGDANSIIHPGQEIVVFNLIFHLQRKARLINWSKSIVVSESDMQRVDQAKLDMVLEIASENAPLMSVDVCLSNDELMDLFRI